MEQLTNIYLGTMHILNTVSNFFDESDKIFIHGMIWSNHG